MPVLKAFHTFCQRLADDESGAALLEYTILLAIITVGAIAAITATGTKIGTLWTNTSTKLSAP